jgi:hypothetical protein
MSILIATEYWRGRSAGLLCHPTGYLSMILPRLINDYEQGCGLDDTVDSAREFELGLHIAALFALLLTSTFGNFLITCSDEC